jgi:hypothetical protein
LPYLNFFRFLRFRGPQARFDYSDARDATICDVLDPRAERMAGAWANQNRKQEH